jgi:uncharacterized membrane protein YbjE (DUF340 family)
MFTVLLFLFLGLLLGFLLRRRLWWLQTADKVAGWAVYWLIFLLGVSVGLNQEVLANLGRLGGQALILSSGALLGSLLLCYLAARFFFRFAPHEG